MAVIEARLLYEAGGILDVSPLFGGCAEDVNGVSLCGDALFNDYKGHGGNFLQNLAALVWLNRIYNVDLSVYNSSALSQFTADMPAVAKAVLDAFDAGNFCGTSTCSTCNVTTPCGVPPVIEPTGCLGDCQVYVTLTIARTMTPDLLKGLCGMIAEAAELEADAVTCTVREGDGAGPVFVDATLETFIQGSGQTVQKVMNRLTRSLMNAELPVWVLDVTVDTMSPSPLPSQPPPSPSPPQHSPSPPPPSPSPPPPSPSPPSPSQPSPSPPACVDTAKKKCKNRHCKDLEKKKACTKTCGLCEPLPPSAPPSPSLPEVNCGGLSDDEACKIKTKKCEKKPPKSMKKCKKKCKKDGKKKTPPLCQKACCKLGFFTPA